PADPSSAADMSLSGSFPESYTLSTWYSQSVQVSGGTPSYSFSISGGALPPGFYIRQDNGTFYLEGVPNTAGEYKFTLRVIDRRNAYTEKEYTVKINGDHTKGDGMSITGRLPDAYTTSSWYTNSPPLKIVGGNGTYTFKITSGGLPPGFYVRQGTPRYSSVYYDDSGRYYTYNNENFYVEGIPTKPGTYTFTLQITDSSDKYVERNLTLNVYGNELTVPEPADPVKITTTSLKNALMGEAYSQDITDAGTATSWSITSGDLPAGLSLDASTGKISGTVADTAIDHNAASAKAYTFTVLAANASGGKSSQTLTISVSERVHFTTDAALPNGKVGEPYEATINVSGTAVDSISRYNTTLPSGLSYISTGRTVIISGMPERAGTYQLRFYASNSWTSDNKMFTLTIEQRADPVEIMTSYIEPAGTGTEYSFAFTASGDATLWQVSGDLPEGLSLDTVKGVIGGTVSENVLEKYSGKNYYPSKTYSFTVTVSNSTGGIDSRNLSMTVYAPVKILTDTLADAQAEQEYNAEIEITGTGMYRYNDTYTSYSFYAPAYSVSGMPEGLSYYQADNGNIRLNGKPAQQGTYSIAIQLRNNYSSQDKTFELYVAPKPAPTPKPQIIVPDNYDGILEAGKNYSFKFRVAGTK
ncbi:MAG: putative Ig domain-containing protein, partial [Synergistaceae bacterium]|nr:putative Ig domain-containing protein [Synergistaceae bacterium]